MTDQNGNELCLACYRVLEPAHTCHNLCDLCCKEMGEDLARLDTDKDDQADGFKDQLTHIYCTVCERVLTVVNDAIEEAAQHAATHKEAEHMTVLDIWDLE